LGLEEIHLDQAMSLDFCFTKNLLILFQCYLASHGRIFLLILESGRNCEYIKIVANANISSNVGNLRIEK
jgi:hypothetical protein